MRKAHTFGIIISIILIIIGIVFPIPDKKLRIGYNFEPTWGEREGPYYVGGDAYNYQIEASLKAGWVSGIMSMKAICFCGGFILLFVSIGINKCYAVKIQQLECLKALSEKFCTENEEKSLTSNSNSE